MKEVVPEVLCHLRFVGLVVLKVVGHLRFIGLVVLKVVGHLRFIGLVVLAASEPSSRAASVLFEELWPYIQASLGASAACFIVFPCTWWCPGTRFTSSKP
jgi:hypothetical protein